MIATKRARSNERPLVSVTIATLLLYELKCTHFFSLYAKEINARFQRMHIKAPYPL